MGPKSSGRIDVSASQNVSVESSHFLVLFSFFIQLSLSFLYCNKGGLAEGLKSGSQATSGQEFVTQRQRQRQRQLHIAWAACVENTADPKNHCNRLPWQRSKTQTWRTKKRRITSNVSLLKQGFYRV